MENFISQYAEFLGGIAGWLGSVGYFTIAGMLFIVAFVLIIGINRYMGQPLPPEFLPIPVIIAGILCLMWIGVLGILPFALVVVALSIVVGYIVEAAVIRLYRFVDGLKGSKM